MNDMRFWYETKMLIERSVAFSPDALHVLAGAAGVLLSALILKRPLTSWLTWVLVLVAAFLNEVADVLVERWPGWGMQAGEGTRDVLLTMAIPTLLLVALRVAPRRFVGETGAGEAEKNG